MTYLLHAVDEDPRAMPIGETRRSSYPTIAAPSCSAARCAHERQAALAQLAASCRDDNEVARRDALGRLSEWSA